MRLKFIGRQIIKLADSTTNKGWRHVIKQIDITNYEGETLNMRLQDLKLGVYVKNIEGLGYPKSNIGTASNVNYDSKRYTDSDIQARNVLITFGFHLDGDNSIEYARRMIYDFLPMKTENIIEFITDERTCYLTGYVETADPDIFEQEETMQVSIICPDPYFYTGGKKEHVVKNEIPLFEVQKWYEFPDNVNAKPVSEQSDSLILNMNSRYQNPRGFTISIRSSLPSFNQLFLEYDSGAILINQSLDEEGVFQIPQTPEGNAFQDVSIEIVNDVNDQNIYIQDSEGNRTSVLNMTIIDGEFPELNVGFNRFSANMFAMVGYETIPEYRYQELPATSHDIKFRVESGDNGHRQDVDSPTQPDFAKAVILVYNLSDELIGEIEFTTKNESLWDTPSYTFTETDDSGNSATVSVYTPLRGSWAYWILVNRYENEPEDSSGGVSYHEGYYYEIIMKTYIDGSITPLSVKVRTITDEFWPLMYNGYKAHSGVSMSERAKTYIYCYSMMDNPLNISVEEYNYEKFNGGSLTVSYDEFYEAL